MSGDLTRLSAEDWRLVNGAFHDALERPDAERRDFVASRFESRPDLRGEVETLLAAHARAERFLAWPAGADTADSAAALVGGMVGHYRVDAHLGAGGMGVVYRARDTKLGRDVALKAIAPAFVGDAGRRDRLEREARAMARLSHPGVATVYALEEFDGRVYLVSEFVPGETLRSVVARGPLEPARVAAIGAAIARALDAAHARGVVHRDLKPENIICTAGGVKVLDFGIAHMGDDEARQRLTADGQILGTPAYMSPEQIRGEPLDARSDVFALGVVLYELLTGRQPFAGGTGGEVLARVLESDVAPSAWPDHPIATIVRRCLAKRPGDRYASAGDVAVALEGNAPPPAAHTPDPAWWWWRFHQIAASVAYGLLIWPVWRAAGTGANGRLGLVTAAALAAAAAGVLRLHLVFTDRSLRSESARQRARVRPWTVVADAAFALSLAATGAPLIASGRGLGVLLVSAAAIVLLVAMVVEPATARAAFRGDRSDG